MAGTQNHRLLAGVGGSCQWPSCLTCPPCCTTLPGAVFGCQSLALDQPVGSPTYHTIGVTGGEISPAVDQPETLHSYLEPVFQLWWPPYSSKAQRHPRQALKDRSTKLTANLQPPHLLKGRAGRDDVVLSHSLLLWLALLLMQDVLSFHFLLQQPGAAVSTGLFPYVQPDMIRRVIVSFTVGRCLGYTPHPCLGFHGVRGTVPTLSWKANSPKLAQHISPFLFL